MTSYSDITIKLSKIEDVYNTLKDIIHSKWETSLAKATEDRETLYLQLKMMNAIYDKLMSELSFEAKKNEPKKEPETDGMDFA